VRASARREARGAGRFFGHRCAPAGGELRPAIILNVQRQPGANVIATVDAIKERLPELTEGLPASLQVTVLSDRTTGIRASVLHVEIELLLAEPSGEVSIRFDGGASDVVVRRPKGVAVGVLVGGGASKLALDDQHFGAIGGETRLESPEYAGATDRYEITITGGASNLTIDYAHPSHSVLAGGLF